MMHGYGMFGHFGAMGPFMWLSMFLFWGLVIVGLIYLVRWISSHDHHHDGKR